MAKNLKLTQLNPFISSVEVGALPGNTTEGLGETGYELELSIPIFDTGGVQNIKARTVFEQAQAQASGSVAAASESRQALVTYQTAWDLAKDFGSELLPLRQRVSQERLLANATVC